MSRAITRTALALAASGAALLLAAAPASAHIGTSADQVAAGGTLALGLTVGHGCDGSPTTTVAVQIPDGVNNATPFAKPGWTVNSEKQTLDTPITSGHGDPVTERVAVITFAATPGNALPDGVRDTFTVNFTAPDTPGEPLYFKTIQTCEAGETAWIQEHDGTGEAPESPAPAVLVTEAEEGSGHGGSSGDHAGTDEVAAEPSGSTGDGDGTELAVVALLAAIVGIVVGAAGYAKARKTADSNSA